MGKLSKGDDDSEHEFTNNLHSNNTVHVYEGICDGIKLSIGSTFDPVVFKWLWSNSLYD